jgi:hypothetical protein
VGRGHHGRWFSIVCGGGALSGEIFSLGEGDDGVLDNPLDKKQPDTDGSMGRKYGFIARGLASSWFCALDEDAISQVGKRKDFGLL